MAEIDLKGLDKAKVLAALYNNYRQQGMGLLNQQGRQDLTVEEARTLLEKQNYFDYLHGRVMKVDLNGETLDPRLYDRDNGEGQAAWVIDEIRRA